MRNIKARIEKIIPITKFVIKLARLFFFLSLLDFSLLMLIIFLIKVVDTESTEIRVNTKIKILMTGWKLRNAKVLLISSNDNKVIKTAKHTKSTTAKILYFFIHKSFPLLRLKLSLKI